MNLKRALFLAWIIGATFLASSKAEDWFQGFETWPPVSHAGTFASFTNYTDAGWVINDGKITTNSSLNLTPPHSGTRAAWFFDYNPGTGKTNEWLQTPAMVIGIGKLSFYVTNSAAGSAVLVVQTSTNQTDWTNRASVTISSSTYSFQEFTLNDYSSNLFVRIAKTNDTGVFPNQKTGIDDISISNPPARVLFSETTTSPELTEVNNPVDITTVIAPSVLASNITATCFWHVVGSPTWIPIQMTKTGFGNQYKTTSAIPGQASPVSVVYYIGAWFMGNDPLSPAFDPFDATAHVKTFTFQPRSYVSDYTSVLVTNNFPASMSLAGDRLWQGVHTSSSNLTNPNFRFAGIYAGGTNFFGDVDPTVSTFPLYGSAGTNQAAIPVTGVYTGQFVFKFAESNLAYNARQCFYQDFTSWPSTPGYEDGSYNGWQAYDAYINIDGDRKTDKACYLDSNSVAGIRSPYLPDGIGEVRFTFRNWETNAPIPPTDIHIQKSHTGSTNASDWVTLATISSVTVTNFGPYSLPLNNRYCNYVRIINSTNTPNARLCLDEVLFAYPGAGVVFTNVTVTPASPSTEDPVTLSCDVTPKCGASSRVVTAYYRTGNSGAFTPLAMTNSGDRFTTSSPIPDGQGDLGLGVGTVQYYFSCSFAGYESEYASPIMYPEAGSNNARSFQVIPAQVSFSNVTTVPYPAQIGIDTYVTADIHALAGAVYLTPTLYYRIGTSGSFTGILMDPTVVTNRYITTSFIPRQYVPGTPVQYYITVTYYGPMAMSPTNYPSAGASAPLTFVCRQSPYLSSFTGVTVNGTFSTNLIPCADYQWQTILTPPLTSNALYRFTTLGAGGTNWGDTNAAGNISPVWGGSDRGGAYIGMQESLNGVLIRFHETNKEYSIQSGCAYMNFDQWSAPDTGFGTYSDGSWTLTSGRTTTNSIGDTSRLFAGRGRSSILSTSGSASIQSPYLSRGIGEINFWYRNWETNGANPACFTVQVSASGTNNWRTIQTVTNILTMDYLSYSYTLSDSSKHYVRILNATNTLLCLDEIVVAQPGPSVSFANVTNAPTSPTIDENVDVRADISPIGGSSLLSARVWYRPGTNGVFDFVVMTNTGGNAFRCLNLIPRGPSGIMQYYVDCEFTGMRTGERVHTYYPSDAPFDTRAFTNSDAYLYQGFETWPPVGGSSVGSYTQDGWGITGSAVKVWIVPLTIDPFKGTKACWMPGYTNNQPPTSWVVTPAITNGLGSFGFYAKQVNTALRNSFRIEYSSNATDWVASAVTNLPNSTNWFPFRYYFLDIEWPTIYVKIVKTGNFVGGPPPSMGLDEIVGTRPPARISIGNIMTHPGYPSATESVNISCTITSRTLSPAAMNISARLHYNRGEEGFINPPIDMIKSGNYFITSRGIPPSSANSTVSYYIESFFDGYHYDSSENMSPSYSPAGTYSGTTNNYYNLPSTNWTYNVREFRSDYSRFNVDSSYTNVTVQMMQLNDYYWQGVLNFITPQPASAFQFAGFSHYTGSNYWGGAADLWGDAAQTHSTLPYSSYAQIGDPAITLPGTNFGQYLFRFNERDRSYTVQRCAFQDFNHWQASAGFFDDSVNRVGIGSIGEGFDSLPMSYDVIKAESFTSWTQTYAYVDYAAGWGNTMWLVYGALVTNQVGSPNPAVQLDPNPGALAYVAPTIYGTPDGLGTLSFKYRCVDTNQPPTFNYAATNFDIGEMYSVTISARGLPTNSTAQNMGTWYASMYFRYTDNRNYYECRVEQDPTRLNRTYISIFRCKNGILQRLGYWDDFDSGSDYSRGWPRKITLYVANTYYYSIPRVWIGVFVHRDDPSRDWVPWVPVWDVDPLLSHGAVGFYSQDADITIDDLSVGVAQMQAFDGWDSDYAPYLVNGSWSAYNARPRWDIGTIHTNSPASYFKSGYLAQGVGNISFHACYSGTDYSVLRIQKSATGGTLDSEWTDLWTQPIINPYAGWWWYQTNANETTGMYIRFLCATNPLGGGGEITLDNIFISPNTNAPGCLVENFNGGNASNWVAPKGKWYVTNNAYNCPGYNADPLTFKIQTAPLVLNPPTTPAEGAWTTTLDTQSNCVNTYYQSYKLDIQKGDPQNIRIRHTGGNGSLVLDDITLTAWHATNKFTPNWKISAGIVTNNAWRTNAIELLRSRAYTNEAQYVMSPPLSNGIGMVSFRHKSKDGAPVTFELHISTDTNWLLHPSTLFLTVTNSSTDWNAASSSTFFPVNTNASPCYYIMILHTTTNYNAALLLDDFQVTDFFNLDALTWRGYNALFTSAQQTRLKTDDTNIKGAYLNNSKTNGTAKPPMTNDAAFIGSCLLTNGIGEISFWYRNWGSEEPYGVTDTPPAVTIKACATDSSRASDWITLTNIPDITNKTFKYFTFMTYDETNKYIRIYCNTNPSTGRLCLDDLLITAPYGATLNVRNGLLSPEAPLYTNDVHLTIELSDFFLAPLVTNVTAYYYLGTNTWATWNPGIPIPMNMVTNHGSYRIYRTAYQIPQQPVDTVVQYRIRCDFAGLFGEKSSPRYFTSFTNPPWYYPVNLNAGKPYSTPYYFSFSCPPKSIWFNELLNALSSYPDESNMEFVEICGPASARVNGWRLQIVSTDTNIQETDIVTNSVMQKNNTNGYGFIVFGDPSVANVNIPFSNTTPGTVNLPNSGGLRLIRSMGAYEYQIAYGPSGDLLIPYGFEHIGSRLTILEDTALGLEGVGRNYTDFTWVQRDAWWEGTNYLSPGAVNAFQELLGELPVDPIEIVIEIVNYWIGQSSNWIVFSVSGTNSIQPTPWYSTNLLTTNWYPITNSVIIGGGTVYTQRFGISTNYPAYFFRISTNGP